MCFPIGFIPFPRVLVLCEMQSASSRIWTRVAVSISYDDNHYNTGTSNFSKAFDSKLKGKMEQILLPYGLPKNIVTTIMILYKDTKAMVHSPDGDTDFFDIITGILQENTLVPFLFVICWDYVQRMLIDLMKENGFTRIQVVQPYSSTTWKNSWFILSGKKKGKKQMISGRNYYWHRLWRWSSTSCKYTCLN